LCIIADGQHHGAVTGVAKHIDHLHFLRMWAWVITAFNIITIDGYAYGEASMLG
jgi:hypothetical protein